MPATFATAGTHYVRLAVRDGDRWAPLSDPIEVRVDWTPLDWALHYINTIGPWLGGGHIVLFLALLIGARWSSWCWAVISGPLWGRVGIWPRLLLYHVPPIQRWVMGRWYDAMRRDLSPKAYLPMPVSTPRSGAVSSDTLLERLRAHRRLWLQGAAGMGKTALVGHLISSVYAENASLAAARRRYGAVPILVRLRDIPDVKPDGKQPEHWVAELARQVVQRDGLTFEDAALFRAVLASGGFSVILDGLNESSQVDIELFAAAAPVPILVTSQTDPARGAFALHRLPPTIHDSIAPLLALFLGAERGRMIHAAVCGTSLWDDIRSGYDVRLLADLAGPSGPLPVLPGNRIELYETILARLRRDGDDYPLAVLCQAAWRMWRDGVRRFAAGTHLEAALIAPLLHDDARVVRVLGGTVYEFRHDQMRGYLAARWAAKDEEAPIKLFKQDKAIWRLDRDEQAVVWGFFADRIDPERGVAIWQWCHDDPERVLLLHALDQRGRRDGWTLVRTPVPEETEPIED